MQELSQLLVFPFQVPLLKYTRDLGTILEVFTPELCTQCLAQAALPGTTYSTGGTAPLQETPCYHCPSTLLSSQYQHLLIVFHPILPAL